MESTRESVNPSPWRDDGVVQLLSIREEDFRQLAITALAKRLPALNPATIAENLSIDTAFCDDDETLEMWLNLEADDWGEADGPAVLTDWVLTDLLGPFAWFSETWREGDQRWLRFAVRQSPVPQT